MTIGKLLQLAKSNLIEDAYHAVESCLVGSNADLTGEITPALKTAVEEELVLYDYEWSDLVFVDNIKLENKIDVKQVLESVVKKLKQEGRYFQEKDNIKKIVLKEVMDLAKVNNKQVIANKMRGGKIQLKEDEAVKKTLPHRAAYAARNAARGDKYVLMLFGVHTSEEYDNEEGITFAKSLEEAANKIDLQYPREEYTIENNMMYCELDEHYEYLFLCKETDIDQAHSEWLKLSEWGMDDEDEDELDEAVTVPLETLEKDTDKISKVAEKTDITITENKQNKMKTNEEKIKSLTEAIQKMTGKKVLLKEEINAKPLRKFKARIQEYERYSTGSTKKFSGSAESLGAFILKLMSKTSWDKEEVEENKDALLNSPESEVISNFEDNNGDGGDYYTIYEIIGGSEKLLIGGDNEEEDEEELDEASNATMDKMVRSKHIDQTTKDKYAKDKEEREKKKVTETVKKDVIKTLKEEITKRAKLVYYIKTGKKVTLKETVEEEGTTLEDQVNLENNIDTPTLGNIMPTSIIKTIEQYVSTTLAEIDKSTTELRTIKKNIVLNSGPSDGSFETLINRIGFLLKQLERVQRYTSNTIKAGVFNKSILDKIFEQKELLNEIK